MRTSKEAFVPKQPSVWAIFDVLKALSAVSRADQRQKAKRERERRRRADTTRHQGRQSRQGRQSQQIQRTRPREWPEPPSWVEGPVRSPTKRPRISEVTMMEDFRNAPPPRGIRTLSPQAAPESAAPAFAKVPARSFVRAARLVVAAGRADVAEIQSAIGRDDATTATIVLALEGTGIIGPPPLRRVLVAPGGLRAILARYGLTEDEADRTEH